jgi:hypothetical protein
MNDFEDPAAAKFKAFLSDLESAPETRTAFPSSDDRVKLVRYILHAIAGIYTLLEDGKIVLEAHPVLSRMVSATVTKESILNKTLLMFAPVHGHIQYHLDFPERDFIFHFRVLHKGAEMFMFLLNLPLDPVRTFGRTKWEEMKLENRASQWTHCADSKQSFGQPDVCGGCGTKTGTMKRCSTCDFIWYCSESCQKSHWNIHKSTCRILEAKNIESKNKRNVRSDGASGSGHVV